MTISLVCDPEIGHHQLICHACNGLSNPSPLQNFNFDWIVCEGEGSCGKIFHLECAADGPPPGIPMPRQENPHQLMAGIWNWKCQQCRHIGLETTDRIDQCYRCSKEFVPEISAINAGGKMPLPKSLWSGYFSICPACKPSCINCTKELSYARALESRLCSPCLVNQNQGNACPVCLRCYSIDEDDDMIQCDSCDRWTHSLCTGFSKKEYLDFGTEGKTFFCRNCSKEDVDPTDLKLTCCVCNIKDYRILNPVQTDERTFLTRFCHSTCLPFLKNQSKSQKTLQSYLIRSGNESKLITNSGQCVTVFKSAWYPYYRKKNCWENVRSKVWVTLSVSSTNLKGKQVFTFDVLFPPKCELASIPPIQGKSLSGTMQTPTIYAYFVDISDSIQQMFKRFHQRYVDIEEIKNFVLYANLDPIPLNFANENLDSSKNIVRAIAPKPSQDDRDNGQAVVSLKQTIQGYLGLAINALGRTPFGSTSTTFKFEPQPDLKNPVKVKRKYTRRIPIKTDAKTNFEEANNTITVPDSIEQTVVKAKRNCTKRIAAEPKPVVMETSVPLTPIVDDLSCARHRFYDRVAAFNSRQAAIIASNSNHADENEDPAEKTSFTRVVFNMNAVPVRFTQKEKDKEKSYGSWSHLPIGTAYRYLSGISKRDLIVARSAIAGYGLFAGRRYVPNELVIEYCGEIIGHALGDRREMTIYGPKTKYHDSCYMFRLDDTRIIDATLKGNAARFINHCCQPNCRTKTFNIDGVHRILIIAQREINEGEELSYDYQFQYEKEEKNEGDGLEDGKQIKRSSTRLPCYCGASKCRGWMN